jgi:hypothetical protein
MVILVIDKNRVFALEEKGQTPVAADPVRQPASVGCRSMFGHHAGCVRRVRATAQRRLGSLEGGATGHQDAAPSGRPMGPRRSMVAAAARLFQIAHHCIEVERGRLLPRRELHEVLDLAGDHGLHHVDDVGM